MRLLAFLTLLPLAAFGADYTLSGLWTTVTTSADSVLVETGTILSNTAARTVGTLTVQGQLWQYANVTTTTSVNTNGLIMSPSTMRQHVVTNPSWEGGIVSNIQVRLNGSCQLPVEGLRRPVDILLFANSLTLTGSTAGIRVIQFVADNTSVYMTNFTATGLAHITANIAERTNNTLVMVNSSVSGTPNYAAGTGWLVIYDGLLFQSNSTVNIASYSSACRIPANWQCWNSTNDWQTPAAIDGPAVGDGWLRVGRPTGTSAASLRGDAGSLSVVWSNNVTLAGAFAAASVTVQGSNNITPFTLTTGTLAQNGFVNASNATWFVGSIISTAPFVPGSSTVSLLGGDNIISNVPTLFNAVKYTTGTARITTNLAVTGTLEFQSGANLDAGGSVVGLANPSTIGGNLQSGTITGNVLRVDGIADKSSGQLNTPRQGRR